MNLDIQIYSLIVSFLFGGLFSFELICFHNLVYKMFNLWKFFLSFVFVIINAIFYFWLLLIINNGVLHVYFLILIVCGYFIFNYMFTHFRKKS